jgi:hypothetical protein
MRVNIGYDFPQNTGLSPISCALYVPSRNKSKFVHQLIQRSDVVQILTALVPHARR